MTPWTYLCFLFGSRRAIEIAAASRGALGLGLLLALVGCFVRGHDSVDMLGEPLRLLRPLGLAILASWMLFLLVETVAGARWLVHRSAAWRVALAPEALPRRGFFTSLVFAYPTFFALFCFTAPLAWPHALPVERWWGAEAASRFDLWLMAGVAVWRVLLIARVVSVLYRWNAASLFVVALLADTLAIGVAAMSQTPSVWSVWSGQRLTPRESDLYLAAMLTFQIGGLSYVVWLFGTLILAVTPCQRPPWRLWEHAGPRKSVALSLWLSALLAPAILAPLALQTQRVQRHRARAEHLLASLDAPTRKQGLRYLSGLPTEEFPTAAFPTDWTPPPTLDFRALGVAAAEDKSLRPWVRELFLRQFIRRQRLDITDAEFHRLTIAEFEALVSCLEETPGGRELAGEFRWLPMVAPQAYFDSERGRLIERLKALTAPAGQTTSRPPGATQPEASAPSPEARRPRGAAPARA